MAYRIKDFDYFLVVCEWKLLRDMGLDIFSVGVIGFCAEAYCAPSPNAKRVAHHCYQGRWKSSAMTI